ncbi:MAG: hypothetical protein QOH61_78 [Chloroflexota bacterium]|jgi:hypothetical protein|nr:hypothetical protein [Chloroflexota bacterium]
MTEIQGRAAAPAAAPPVSLAICTGSGWPHVERFVRALEHAAAEVDGEVIVADGSGKPAPPADSLGASTRWLSFPRSSVYELRPALLEACRAEIIAMTEDHCRVEPNWAAALLAAHADHPEALSIGGPVDNLATDRTLDWASFFVVQAGVVPPVTPGARRKLAHANVSYKRAALDLAPKVAGMGVLDSFHQASLARTDGAIRMDPRPLVWHDQSLPVGPFVAQHFHAGRTFGGFVRATGGRRPAIRLLVAPAVPWLRLGRAAALASRSRHAERLPAALPWMLALLSAQVAGQVAGILLGAGESPLHVEG